MSERREPLAGPALDRFTRRLGFQMRLAQRASRKRKSWLDRLVTTFLRRATRPKPDDDFMRDEIVDAGVGFSAEELEAYQQSSRAER
ncbi:MAG: hypothetical protein HKP30_09895 [Myxococcales bacterium]|nr:hypothetical protein [Myxococcales bacterium]